jgi:hypothetical protein
VKVEIPFTKIKILQEGADFMMQNTVIGVILTIMSMILVTSFTPTRKLSNTEMVALSDQNAEILRFCLKFDAVSGFPDIPDVLTDMQVTTKSLFADIVRTKVMAEDVGVAAGLSA